MKKLELQQMEMIEGGGMSFDCGLAIFSLGMVALGAGALTGGAGTVAVWMLGTAGSSVGFMRSCGPSDFY